MAARATSALVSAARALPSLPSLQHPRIQVVVGAPRPYPVIQGWWLLDECSVWESWALFPLLLPHTPSSPVACRPGPPTIEPLSPPRRRCAREARSAAATKTAGRRFSFRESSSFLFAWTGWGGGRWEEAGRVGSVRDGARCGLCWRRRRWVLACGKRGARVGGARQRLQRWCRVVAYGRRGDAVQHCLAGIVSLRALQNTGGERRGTLRRDPRWAWFLHIRGHCRLLPRARPPPL